MSLSPNARQFMIAVAVQFAAISVGAAVTFPTLLLEQFGKNDTSVQLDLNTRSWIGSVHGLAGIPAILMPIVAQIIGRKLGYIISCLFLITAWILAYTAKTAAEILISESFHGLGTNSLNLITFVSLSEMMAPKYRYISMQAFSMVNISGMTVGGILGRYLHYRTVSLIMLTSISIAFALTALWTESPYWLACRGKFKECETSFLKLRGNDEASLKELKELITAQKEILSRGKVKKTFTFQRLWAKISSRDFYMPSLHSFVLLKVIYWSGCSVILIYFVEIVGKTTNDQNATFYGSIAMYIIFFIGSIATTILVMWFKNKTIILFSACVMLLFLFCILVVTGLQSLGVLAKDSYLFMYFLIGFTVTNGISLVYLVAADIMPVRHRNLGGALYIIFNCMLQASSLKLWPYLSLNLGLFGTFLIYTANAIFCTLFIWKYVPETKGKTLQELEDFYMYGHFVQRNDNAEITLNTDGSYKLGRVA